MRVLLFLLVEHDMWSAVKWKQVGCSLSRKRRWRSRSVNLGPSFISAETEAAVFIVEFVLPA